MSFIGDGPSEAFLKEMVCRKGIDKKVIFLGARDRAYVYKTLKDYDLLIQPSFYEGFGLTITEAIAAKVPVLVSDIEGPMEIIEKGKFGYFFEKGNGAAAAGQIVKIMNMSEAEKNDLINSAYEHVVAKFDIKNTATRYLTEYASL
jgi:glycosyltransferase involved in cell wall biosynthesis